jgi:hypothetical protein
MSHLRPNHELQALDYEELCDICKTLDHKELCDICETLDFENGGKVQFAGAVHFKATCLLCTWILERHKRYATVFPGFGKDGTDPIVVTVIPQSNFLGLELVTSSHSFGPTFQYDLFLDLGV